MSQEKEKRKKSLKSNNWSNLWSQYPNQPACMILLAEYNADYEYFSDN